MLKKTPLLLAIFILSSCALQTLGEGLPRLNGKHIDTAINYLGVPDAEQHIAGRKVYIWGNEESGTYLRPVTNYTNVSTYGAGGYAYGTATTTSYVPEHYSHSCTIKLIANSKDIIQNSEFKGDQGGCSAFEKGISRLIKDTNPVDSSN